MKKLLFFMLWVLCFNPSKATIHVIGVWSGYYKYEPNTLTIQLGDTIQWLPYFGNLPTLTNPHTITSASIPIGATAFDVDWKLPADTFFQYVPKVAGLYNYVCTPHSVSMNMTGSFQVDIANGIPNNSSSVSQLSIFPNPTVKSLTICGENITAIEVYNLAGEKIQELTKINQQTSTTIDVSSFSKGIYFAKIFDGITIYTKKIIVQ